VAAVTAVAGLLATPVLAQFTQQGPKLVGTGNVFGIAEQGVSVSISGDGNTAIVGGMADIPAGILGEGAAWVFTRSGGVWSQQGNKLVGTGAVGPAGQGQSVAISSEGNTAIVGGPSDDGSPAIGFVGAAWVFTRLGGSWSQEAKLVPTDAIGKPNLGFSASLSSDGNTALVGGVGDNGGNGGAGAAWVFTRAGGVWTQEAKLVGTGAIGNAEQGFSVSLSGDGNTAIVGGRRDDSFSGAAWVFTRVGGVWTEQAKLVGADAIGNSEQGYSVAISSDGNTVMLGGLSDNDLAGAAWVFTRSGGLWTEQAKLVATDAIGNAQQGWSVALSGDGNTAFVGGPTDNAFNPLGACCVGAAWVFRRVGSTWSQQEKLVGTGANGYAQQGHSVSISADGRTGIVGGPADNRVPGGAVGAAWVYAQPQPVFAGTPGRANCFGQSVSALAREFGGLSAAAAGLGYSDGRALQDAIRAFCGQ
jgi:hypothetical protein